MEITAEKIFNITNIAKSRFTDQASRLYWKEDRKELGFEEKRIAALIEAVALEMKLEVEAGYEI